MFGTPVSGLPVGSGLLWTGRTEVTEHWSMEPVPTLLTTTRLPAACKLAMVSAAEGPVGAAAAVPAPSAIMPAEPTAPITPVIAMCWNFMSFSIFVDDSVTLQGYVDRQCETTNSYAAHMISKFTV